MLISHIDFRHHELYHRFAADNRVATHPLSHRYSHDHSGTDLWMASYFSCPLRLDEPDGSENRLASDYPIFHSVSLLIPGIGTG